MHVPLLDLSQQYRALATQIRAATDEVFASQRFILGSKSKEFEKAIAAYCGVPHAMGVSSGTDAILTVLMTLKIGLGDAIITPAYSFFATGACVARVGATPVFVDVDPKTYNISPSALRHYIDKYCTRSDGKLINEKGQTISAIIPVHIFGQCCEMNEVLEIAQEHGLLVIEDAAQAIGAEYPLASRPAKAGTMGDAACFSFYPSKNLGAAGDAGLVVCRSDEFAARLRSCRQHGMDPRYYHEFIGGNFRLDEIQAAVLNVKLPYLDGWSAARREAARFYSEEFRRAGFEGKIIPPAEAYAESGLKNHHIYHQYVIRAPRRRDDLRAYLTSRDIETAIYYPLGLHEQTCFKYLGYKRGDFPETERAARETLALPIYPEISREAQRYVANSIAEFFK